PEFGSRTRIAPEERDHLVIDEVPDVFHAGHTHTFGAGVYRDVRVVDTGCWQYQTPFQRRVNIDPDVGVAAIVSLDRLELTARTFA
ncbi:MAG: DNA polymerase II small subunit, partial [Halobacteriota archaeon]